MPLIKKGQGSGLFHLWRLDWRLRVVALLRSCVKAAPGSPLPLSITVFFDTDAFYLYRETRLARAARKSFRGMRRY
ncbi:MAG: hypothetical protein ABIH03_03215 [Pseudomonadota bacterium]